MKARIKTAILLLLPSIALAQVPVDDDGNVIGTYEAQADITSVEGTAFAPLSAAELEELIGPVALYPDDLLAIVLPASAYPLQIVEAARFLEALESDPTLKPNPNWDDSVVALTNYPEVVELLNSDLDWTLRLGEAVVQQQADVVAAVEAFRDRAYDAGNLKSDSYQTVSVEDDVIQISPVSEDVIYVPYYEPAQVVYYQPRPVYYYYPRPYPVYYYPYSASHHFYHDRFWGVTTAFTIGWYSDSLHVYHHSYRGHPYYGRSYWDNWWYRRPSINVYNTAYYGGRHVTYDRYRHGDRWRPSRARREYVVREGYTRDADRRKRLSTGDRTASVQRQQVRNQPISFRERDSRTTRTATATRRVSPSAENRNRDVRRRSDTVVDQRQQRTQRTQQTVARNDAKRNDEIVFRSRDSNRQVVADRRETVQQRGQTRTQRAPAERRQSNATQRAPQRVQPSTQRVQRAPVQAQKRAPQQRVEQRSTTRMQRAPAPQQSRRTESRQPVKQESRSGASRGRAEKPARESRSDRPRSRDRKRN